MIPTGKEKKFFLKETLVPQKVSLVSPHQINHGSRRKNHQKSPRTIHEIWNTEREHG
jgi:hypothetical protein